MKCFDLFDLLEVISFLLLEKFPELTVVASDRCPNACFSVRAEQSRWARQGQERRLEVTRSDLFDDLQNEEAFESI